MRTRVGGFAMPPDPHAHAGHGPHGRTGPLVDDDARRLIDGAGVDADLIERGHRHQRLGHLLAAHDVTYWHTLRRNGVPRLAAAAAIVAMRAASTTPWLGRCTQCGTTTDEW